LRDHRVYIQDERPGRKSSAYGISESYKGHIPTIKLDWVRRNYPGLHELSGLSSQVARLLALPETSRMLFNVQEYYQGSEAVPKHFDGELLKFERKDDKLDIIKAIRPLHVAVLTLVNDVEGAGTRLHYEDGTSVVVPCEAGDLLIFENHNALHSVDRFEGDSIRPDGLVRMVIGWRSLTSRCEVYRKFKGQHPVTSKNANALIEQWLDNEWPKVYDEHLKGKDAAF
jgi:hypothetical protein